MCPRSVSTKIDHISTYSVSTEGKGVKVTGPLNIPVRGTMDNLDTNQLAIKQHNGSGNIGN